MPQGNDETLDSETKEILESLEKEGHELEPTEDKPEVVPAPKPEEPAPEPKPEAEKPKVEEPERKEPERQQVEKPARTPQSVPVNKFNETRHELQEAKAKIAELETALQTKGPTPTKAEEGDIRKAVTALAEEAGLDTEFLTKFADIIIEKTKGSEKKEVISADVMETLKQFQSERAEMLEAKAFDADFAAVIKEFPELADKKDEIKEIAYTEGNERIPLRALAITYRHDNPTMTPKKTAESGNQPGAGRDAGEVIDFDNVTEAQMKDPNFPLDKFLEHQEAKEAKARGATTSKLR